MRKINCEKTKHNFRRCAVAYSGGAWCHGPPFGVPVMHKCLRIVREIESWPPLAMEFGQKIWLEKRAESAWRPFFGLHLNLARKTGEFWEKTFFFFGLHLNLSEDLFLLVFLILKFPGPPLSKILRTLVEMRTSILSVYTFLRSKNHL